MLKKHLPVFVVGIFGGVFAFYLTSHFHSYDNTKALSLPSSAPLPTDSWQNVVANESLSTVAVQSFSGGALLKQSSGMILSADGLIVTTADAVVSGGYYQVLADDKILKAPILTWDYGKNLAIFKVSAQDLNVADLDDLSNSGSGQELVITGKFVNLSKPVVFSQKALINYVLDRDVVLDTVYNGFLNGAKVVDKNSRMIGMAYTRSGKIHLISSQAISDFLKAQFSKKESKKERTN